MSFRRAGKRLHQETEDWREWKRRHAELLRQCGFPESVLSSRSDWLYFLKYGYHCKPAYPHIDFNSRDMSPTQLASLLRLLEDSLTPEEKRRGNAMWPPTTD
jgi:hypothetical protein